MSLGPICPSGFNISIAAVNVIIRHTNKRERIKGVATLKSSKWAKIQTGRGI